MALSAVWIDSARGRLAAGGDISDAFLGLLGDGVPPEDAAKAVCVAVGSTPHEAVERMREFAGLWEAIGPGHELDGVGLLVEHGYFEPDAVLDERQRAALNCLREALDAVPGIPSGLAVSLHTKLRTGRLADAVRQLERLGNRRWPDNARFWAALRRAGRLV